MKNKKAQLAYLLIGIILVLVFAIVAIPMATIFDRITTEFSSNPTFNRSNVSVENLWQVQGQITPWFDQLIFFILVGVIIGVIIIAVFTDYHPVVLVALILITIIIAIVGSQFVNIYDKVKTDPAFSDKADEFTFTNAIFGSAFSVMILIAGTIASIVLLAKRGRATAPV